jgi:small nuclear ribonucleoprotein (snRNP)-like protein
MGSKGPNLRCVTQLLVFYLYILLERCFRRSYLDKKISLHLNKGRKVSGTLRGYDQFMNIVLGDAVDDANTTAKDAHIGMVVSIFCP